MYSIFVATLLETMNGDSPRCTPRCTKESEAKVKLQAARTLPLWETFCKIYVSGGMPSKAHCDIYIQGAHVHVDAMRESLQA